MNTSISKNSKLETGYKYGFTTNIESEQIPKGIDEKTVHLISSIKKEPKWVTDFRLLSLINIKTQLLNFLK